MRETILDIFAMVVAVIIQVALWLAGAVVFVLTMSFLLFLVTLAMHLAGMAFEGLINVN